MVENRKPVRLIRVMLLAGIVVLAVMLVLRMRPGRAVADRWREELAAIPDDAAIPRIEQLPALGDDSLPLLVELVHGDREPLAAAARDVIDREWQRWRQLPVDQSSPRVERLIRLLAERADHADPRAREFRQRLAARALHAPVDRDRVDGTALIAACERLLATSPRIAVEAPPRIE